jgi:hypothetical protein
MYYGGYFFAEDELRAEEYNIKAVQMCPDNVFALLGLG